MTTLPTTADVVVVGAGIIGLSTAWELSQRGLKVCVLERDETGRSCSWAGGGLLSPLPPDAPIAALEPLLSRSLASYPQYCSALQAETGIDPEYWVCGARWVSANTERVLPDIAQVRNPRLLKALRAALSQRDVPILEHTTVIGWQTSGDRLTGMRTSNGHLSCAQAVLAAGAWSGQLTSVPIRPTKGQMLLFKAEPGVLDQVLIGEQAYLIPRRDGHILLGSTIEDVGFDTQPTASAKDELLQRGAALWAPLRQLAIQAHWAGLRPRGEGVAPLIEASTQIRGLFLNTGHFRLGITLAPASARRLAQQMLSTH